MSCSLRRNETVQPQSESGKFARFHHMDRLPELFGIDVTPGQPAGDIPQFGGDLPADRIGIDVRLHTNES